MARAGTRASTMGQRRQHTERRAEARDCVERRASFLSVLRWTFDTLGMPLPPGRIRQAPTLDDCFDMTQAPPPKLVLPPSVACGK